MRGTSFLHYYMLVYTPSHKMKRYDDFMEDMLGSMLDRVPLYLQSTFNHDRNFFTIFGGAYDIHLFMTNHKVRMS